MSHMQSVLGGQTLGMIVITAPDFPVWTGSQHLRDQDPFYHENIYSQEKAHIVGLFIPRFAGIVAWPGFGL